MSENATKRTNRRPLCVFASPLLPEQKAGGRLRTCSLACFGGWVRRMVNCQACEYHVPVRPVPSPDRATSEGTGTATHPPKPCNCPKKLVTLADHDAAKLLTIATAAPVANGIACPSCGRELHDSEPGMLTMKIPPQVAIGCAACGFTGERLV
jgi:hypothetical protein